LVAVAYLDWMKRSPSSQSNWRVRLGFTSMVVICADWCFFIFLVAIARAKIPGLTPIDIRWFVYLRFVPLLASFLALSLTGRARLFTIAAGFSMAIFWAAGLVE
jgi:hypothetical protein